MTARESRLRILVVRQSLPSKPNSRRESEKHNERHSARELMPLNQLVWEFDMIWFGNLKPIQSRKHPL